MTLVDTNVLIDLATNDPVWADWSQNQLAAAAQQGPLVINEIVYAELSVGFERITELDEFIATAAIDLAPMPKQALFLAGKAYSTYRRSGGGRSSILADFFIGAHATASKLSLLTRDARKYQTYFPGIIVIAPETR